MGCGSSIAPTARGAAAAVVSEISDTPREEKAELPPTVLIDEPELDGVQDVTVPNYWTNKRHTDQALFSQMVYVSQTQHPTFDELLKNSYEAKSTKDRPCPKREGQCERQSQGCPCVRVDGDPGLPTGFCVRRVVRVENSHMWARYAKRRNDITALRSKEPKIHHFDPFLKTNECVKNNDGVFAHINWRMNECYLWHGTHVRTALSIATNDFDMDKAGTGRGAMYGPGAYFAESCTKADEYAFDEPGGYYDGIHAMLLCRVCMGKMFYTTKFGVEDAGEKVKEGHFDSVLGDLAKYRLTFREFVVYNADQIYPEYVVLYQRVHRADNIADIREIAATPFHLELPVYWRNNHKVPAVDNFDEQCRLRTVTCDLLQHLASGTSKKEVKLETARRIENSKLWTQYVAFKAKVRAFLQGDVLQPALNKSSRCITASALSGDSDRVATLKFLLEQKEYVEESISVDNLDSPLNEHLLWYGACQDDIRSMAHFGLELSRGSNNPELARYGQGLYLSETLDRLLDFAEADEKGIKYMLLCRVCCGEFDYTEAKEDPDAVNRARNTEGKHTLLANPEKSGLREFVCLDNTQIYPEFVLELKVAAEPEAPIAGDGDGDGDAPAEEAAPAAEE